MPDRARVDLRSDHAELCRLIGFAEAFARRHLLPGAERARLLVVLEELFTNAVNHGYPGGRAAGRIDITLAVAGAALTIAFSDDGRPFDPLARTPPDLDRPATERPIGGLGLRLLRAFVDEARYCRRDGRNHLVLIRNLAHSGPKAHG